MNTKALVLFLSVASLSGCASNRVYNGNVTFTWSFPGGLACSSVPQVASIAINIPGEILENNGVYPCSTNNYPGIILYDFVPGPYNFTVQALDSQGSVLLSASGSFTIDGDVTVTVPLQWTVGGVSVQWQISGSDCFHIPTVYVNFGDSTGRFLYPGAGDAQSCASGLPNGAIRYDYLPPGNYVITLQGRDGSGFLYSNTPYPAVTITAGRFSDSQTIGSTLHL